jgi:hypothetical protein
MNLKATMHRMRFANSGPSRPYKVQIRNRSGQDVAPNMCYVIAADGGKRPDFPSRCHSGLPLSQPWLPSSALRQFDTEI